ncbi:hypothetical protein HPB47_022257 [Ixodes persulcatus]|uniref:Uncharacterized protein n=1 Tax=Ixodes persulcatus TaxID=34615 RepID=A0AC60QA84_IXOPE|nr:hypothetical protein HPB47_022257 [Ixodes persulcatus]
MSEGRAVVPSVSYGVPESSLLRRGFSSTACDDGGGKDRTTKHVQAVAWINTTHGTSNAAALSTTEDVDTTQAELTAPLRASQRVLQTFAPIDNSHRLLLFTDSTRAYETCGRARGSPSMYTGIVGELHAAFLELRDTLNIQATISCVPANSFIDGNEWAQSEERAAVRQMASTPNAFHNSASDAAGPANPSADKEIGKQRRQRTIRHLRGE